MLYYTFSTSTQEDKIMDKKKFRLCRIIITMAVAALVGWSVTTGNALLPLIAVGVGMGLLYLCKKRVKGVIEDERIYKISEKASRITLAVLAPIIAVAGVVLIALSKRGSADLSQIGFTLAYTACALMVLYTVLYFYYEKKS